MESSLRKEEEIKKQIDDALNLSMVEIEKTLDMGLERISNRLDACLRAIIRLHKARMKMKMDWDSAPKRMVA